MEKQLTKIAKEIIRIETLETQNSDVADFHEISVWTLKKALEEAYQAGKRSSIRN